MEISITMFVIKLAIDVLLSLMFVANTRHGNVAMERSPIIQKHLFAVKEVSVFCTIPTEVQGKPDVAVMQLFSPTGRFAAKVTLNFFRMWH